MNVVTPALFKASVSAGRPASQTVAAQKAWADYCFSKAMLMSMATSSETIGST